MRLGILSEKYEGGGAGTISTGEGDSGGISYGTYQLASNVGTVQEFVEWLQDKYPSFYAILSRNEAGTLEFSADWTYLADNYPEEFAQAQDEFVTPKYYDSACAIAQENGVDTGAMPDALKAVLFSNSIQHGAYWAGVLLAESYSADPEEWIRNIYNTKLNDESWSSGAPSLRYGLFNRWRNEMEDAVKLLIA